VFRHYAINTRHRCVSFAPRAMKDFGIVVLIVLAIFVVGMITVCIVAATMARGRDNTLEENKVGGL
jgi:hypothetical protein